MSSPASSSAARYSAHGSVEMSGYMPTMMLPSVASSLPLAEISLRLPCGPYCWASVPDCAHAVFQVMNGVSEMMLITQSALVVAWATSAE